MGYNLNFSSQYVDGTLPEWFTDKYHDQLCFNGGLSISSKNAGYKSHFDFENMLRDYRKVLFDWYFEEKGEAVSVIYYDDDHDTVGIVKVYVDAICYNPLNASQLFSKIDIYGN